MFSPNAGRALILAPYVGSTISNLCGESRNVTDWNSRGRLVRNRNLQGKDNAVFVQEC